MEEEKKLMLLNMFKTGVRAHSNEFGKFEEITVSMRDGVRLRTLIYFPKGQGPWPTLFTRTPYAQLEEYAELEGLEYAKRGYVYVLQFCRGTGGSEGKWVPNDNERNDGIDSINWLVEQPWARNIGIHGVSYMSLTTWIIADVLPEKVKALYLCHYSVDRYLSAYKAGLFRHDVLTGWTMGNTGKEALKNFHEEYIIASLYRPHIKVDEELWGIKLDWYRQWITNTDYDNEYWQSGFWKMLRETPEKIKVPVCLVAGWYDHHLEGTVLGYEKLNEVVKSHSRLIVGGWNHDRVECVPAHKPKNASINPFAHMLDWFDSTLIDEKLPDSSIETYFVGDDKWQKWDTWPLKNTGVKEIYLTAENSDESSCYTLDFHRSKETKIIQYEYDPTNPVYTHGGETLLVSGKERGSLLQDKPGMRCDNITFISEVLTEDTPIAGKVNTKLFVSSDCEDTCFTAKIMEVLPNGEAYNIRSSITTLAYRNNSSSRLEYTPDEIVEINIDCLPITWNVKKGSRIRIDISSSNFPEYAIHSNFPGIWSLQEKVKTAHQTIYCGGKYISMIEIPIASKL